MKKILIGFILGGILFGSIGIYAASYLAKDILYQPEDTSWNVNNVDDALNSLYDYASLTGATLLWSNPDVSKNFSAQTITLDLSEYDAIVVDVIYAASYKNNNRTMQVFPKDGKSYNLLNGYYGANGSWVRTITVSDTGVIISSCSQPGGTFPNKIYGIKGITAYPEV